VGFSFVAALYKADKLNDRSARHVCSLGARGLPRKKVRQFADFREIIHFSDGH
jgi:hypothetical protein